METRKQKTGNWKSENRKLEIRNQKIDNWKSETGKQKTENRKQDMGFQKQNVRNVFLYLIQLDRDKQTKEF